MNSRKKAAVQRMWNKNKLDTATYQNRIKKLPSSPVSRAIELSEIEKFIQLNGITKCDPAEVSNTDVPQFKPTIMVNWNG